MVPPLTPILITNPPAQTGRSSKLWPTSVCPQIWLGRWGGGDAKTPNTLSFTLIQREIWISKAYLDNTSFECQIADGSWRRLEDARMWKNHTLFDTVDWQVSCTQTKKHTHTPHLLFPTNLTQQMDTILQDSALSVWAPTEQKAVTPSLQKLGLKSAKCFVWWDLGVMRGWGELGYSEAGTTSQRFLEKFWEH